VDTDEVSDLIVDVATRVIMPRFGHLEMDDVHEKRRGDLVTVADREAEATLGAALEARSPGALIVGEENVFAHPDLPAILPSAEQAWVIDPIDGTRNFTRSSPDFGVMVAEVVRGEAVRGWIYQPALGHIYVAEHGAGVRLDGLPLVAPAPGRERLLGATDPGFGRHEAVDVRRPWGACALDYPKLCAGEIDFYACGTAHVWDHLPGALMVTELGGRVATELGERYRPGVSGRRVIATMPAEIWDAVRAICLDA